MIYLVNTRGEIAAYNLRDYCELTADEVKQTWVFFRLNSAVRFAKARWSKEAVVLQ